MTRNKRPVHLLSAEWFNARANNVYDRAVSILMDILDDLTESGYLPLEVPRSEEFNQHATDEQLVMIEVDQLIAEQPAEQ